MNSSIIVRPMCAEDAPAFFAAFEAQGWDKPLAQFEQYYQDQQDGVRKVYVAADDTQVFGYATLLPQDETGPFANKGIPTICDFNVLVASQGQGIGSAILDAIEDEVATYSDLICLGVGLHSGYGAAQRLYVKRGYIPDGSGVWFDDRLLDPHADCCNDDSLNLFLSKELNK